MAGSVYKHKFLHVQHHVAEVGPDFFLAVWLSWAVGGSLRGEELHGLSQLPWTRLAVAGALVDIADALRGSTPLFLQQSPRPKPRLAEDKRVVHQDQRLRGHIGHRALAHGRKRHGRIESPHYRRRKIAAHFQVNAPAAIAVQRTAACCFFFNDTATTEIYTLSLHDALPI